MSIGCIICHEAFKSTDPADSYPMLIKECGHVLHSKCLKQWLLKSKTCPTCRTVTRDNADSITRIHLQTVETSSSAFSLDILKIYKLLSDMTAVKDKEIAGLREQLAETQTKTNELIPLLSNIIEVGSDMRSTKVASVVPVPAAAQPNKSNTTAASTRTPVNPRVAPSGSRKTTTRMSTGGNRTAPYQTRRRAN